MNSPEFYLLLVDERGWSPEEFESWLAESLDTAADATVIAHERRGSIRVRGHRASVRFVTGKHGAGGRRFGSVSAC